MKRPEDLHKPELSANAEQVLAKRYYIKDKDGQPVEGAADMFWRVASTIAAEEAKYEKSPWAGTTEQLARKFYELMARGIFLPNSPTLMNAGRELGQLSACFVLPVPDSTEEIFDAVKYAALIHKSGGGTGFSFSRLRPKNARVRATGGVASGPVSFMRIFNTATEQIKQGGTRRGANMGILRVDHPDIIEFIRAKEQDGEFNNFNLSVALTEDFMKAVDRDDVYPLVDPSTGETVQTMNAASVFELLVEKAWATGDPGVIFLDRINAANPTPELGDIEATNPCGEQPLLPYEACNLGSINLAKFVRKDEACVDFVDWNKLREVVGLAVRFLDDVIDANRYPLPRIANMVARTRKIGLGVMGWADMLFQLGIPYNSDKARAVAGRVMESIQYNSRMASGDLARERGAFPEFASSALAESLPVRNATRTTIAPTGTLSIIAGCSSGIEPVFALSFTRNVMDGAHLTESNRYFEQALKEAGLDAPAILQRVAEGESIQTMPEVPDTLKRVFVTAPDMSGEDHLRMQAVFQKYTDNAVSKTVNLPNSATVDEVRRIYLLAYELGCKGVTVYRDGCKAGQVLTTGKSSGAPENIPVKQAEPTVKRERPELLKGFTQKIRTGLGTLYLTVNEVDGQPFEVFATIGKSGRSVTAKAEAIGRMVSLCLRSGVPVKAIVAQLKGIGGEHPQLAKGGLVLSLPDAVARVLEERYLSGEAAPVESHVDADLVRPICPDCGAELVFQEGCQHCPNCGYSKCG